MDQKQKESLKAAALQLADELKFEDLVEHLKLAKLVTAAQIEIIVTKAQSNFCRNISLIEELVACDSPGAFEDFLQILELTDNIEAIKLISPGYLDRNNDSTDGPRAIIRKLHRKYIKSDSSSQYPLGMNSSTTVMTSSTPSQSTGALKDYQDNPSLSPLKEKHQATLITSGTSTPNFDRLTSREGGSRSFECTNSTWDERPSPHRENSSTPPTGYQQNNRAHFQLQQKRQAYASRSSQTPSRPHELVLMNNLSISEPDESHSDNQEPVVCWHPYAHSEGSSAHRSASPHCCHPSYASSESDSSSDSLSIDPSLILDSNVTMAIAKGGSQQMAVKPATVCHRNPEEDYKMTARPRGPCLIVNNIDFEAEIFPTRKGSDEDAKRFDDIFQQLGFTVIMRRNQTADQMRQLFKDVAAECKPEHDALFVFILSHGSEHGIYGTDGLEVYLESEIISCFDNRNCKAMLGKPKVFVIQACRGSKYKRVDE